MAPGAKSEDFGGMHGLYPGNLGPTLTLTQRTQARAWLVDDIFGTQTVYVETTYYHFLSTVKRNS